MQEQTAVTLSPQEIIDACKHPEGLNLFAGLLLGEIMEHEFPPTHQAYWALLVNAALAAEAKDASLEIKEAKFALGLPRGTAKTTLMKLFACWLILYTTHKYFLVVSSNSSKAKMVIADVFGFLSCRNVRAIWGSWDNETDKETQELTIFKFNDRSVIVEALGSGSSVRGSNIRNERPGVIICEDIQEKECAESETLNKEFIAWFVGTLLKARSYRRSLIIYIGNMYNEICLLHRLQQDKNWISLITAALLHDGTSIWPEFRTKESILREYNSDVSLGQGAVFLAEVMNDPKAYQASWIDLSKIKAWPYAENEIATATFLTIDPALGKASSDNTAIATHSVFDGHACCMDVEGAKLDDTGTVERALAIALQTGACLIAVEAVAYQSVLCNYFLRTMRSRGITGIIVMPISTHGIPKVKRIENFLKKSLTGEVLIHPTALQKIIFQASRYNPLKKENEDDLLDAAAYGDQTLAEFWREIYEANSARFDEDLTVAHVMSSAVTNSF